MLLYNVFSSAALSRPPTSLPLETNKEWIGISNPSVNAISSLRRCSLFGNPTFKTLLSRSWRWATWIYPIAASLICDADYHQTPMIILERPFLWKPKAIFGLPPGISLYFFFLFNWKVFLLLSYPLQDMVETHLPSPPSTQGKVIFFFWHGNEGGKSPSIHN